MEQEEHWIAGNRAGDNEFWHSNHTPFGSFSEPVDTEAAARSLSECLDHRPERRLVRKLEDHEWQPVVAHKLLADGYVPAPWDEQNLMHRAEWHAVRGFFPHVSPDDPKLVRFIASDEHGKRGRFSVMKPTKFLMKYGGGTFTVERAEELGHQYAVASGPGEFHLATTPDEIENVYVNGPSSCMAGSDFYEGYLHPARVYGAGDLAVAYVTLGDRITARCVVWPDKALSGRVYGDGRRMHAFLSERGYTSGGFNGARLLKIYDGGCSTYIMPYLDGEQEVASVDSKHFEITSNGEYICNNTNGLIDDGCSFFCPCCENRVPEDEVSWVDIYNEHWCGGCIDSNLVYSDAQGQLIQQDDAVLLDDGDYVTADYLAENGYECEATGKRGLDLDDFYILEDGTVWHHSHFDEHGFICDHTGEPHDRFDGVELTPGVWVHKAHVETYKRDQLEAA